MANKMLIDASHPEETRVVVLRGNRVEEFDFESASKKPLRGNIYLAKVTRVEPSLQAAFIEYGGNRHGFLAFSEIHPDYYQIPVADRQALLEEEQRQHSEEEEEEPRQRRSRRRRRNGRERRAPNGESISGEAPASAESDGVEAASEEAGATDAPAIEFSSSFEQAPETAGTEPAFTAPESAAAASDQPEAPLAAPLIEAEVASGVEAQAFAKAPSEDENDDHEDEDDEDDDHEDDEEDHVEQIGGDDVEEMPVRASRPRRQYKIQEVIRRRQVLLVQVVKEERGNKGAALTTYLSLAGRYSVLMPNTARGGGISRKITDSEDRKRMKEIAQDLDVPEGMGVILRTAGASRSKQEVRRDFEHLLRMWESVRELTLESSAPTLVYEEGSLIKRTVRDLYSEEIDEIVVAGDHGYKEARDYMRMLMPSHARKIQHWRETQPLFARMGVEAQLDAMFSAQVTLKSGGYIVINQTEALVAIDVNSGRSTREHNIEDTALRTNLEAADEVARQLRLRDLAGLIVVDFIDMEEHRNNRAVERRLKEALKNDRARIQVGRISHFGLLEMSRQRMRTGVLEGSSVVCPHCNGAGTVRSTASIALHILRVIEDALVRNAQYNITVRTRSVVALYMLNQKRAHLSELEMRFGVTIVIAADDTLTGSTYHALERGDLASAPAAAPRQGLVQIDSLAPGPEDEEPEAPEADNDDEEGDDDKTASGEDNGDSNRRRRRRRRRRGRDRDPSGIDPDAPQPSDEALAAMAQFEGVLSGGVLAGDLPAAALPASGDGEVDEAEAEREGEAIAQAANSNEDGEGRRRRRPRRGRRSSERTEQGEQPEARSPQGSWVRSADSGEPEFDMRAEPVDLTAFAPEPAPSAPTAETVASAEPEVRSVVEPAPASDASAGAIIAPAPKAETVAEPSVAAAEPAPQPAPEPAAAEPAKPAPAWVEPLPEAPPPTQKRGGWWQRKGQ